jgi:chromosomal replication initiation ATPase DnaA
MSRQESKIDREIRESILETLEAVVSIPREYWERKRSKKREEVIIRQIYIYMLNKYTIKTQQEIAEICNLKYHTSIIRNKVIVKAWMKDSEKYSYQNLIINQFNQLYEQRINNNTEASTR